MCLETQLELEDELKRASKTTVWSLVAYPSLSLCDMEWSHPQRGKGQEDVSNWENVLVRVLHVEWRSHTQGGEGSFHLRKKFFHVHLPEANHFLSYIITTCIQFSFS